MRQTFFLALLLLTLTACGSQGKDQVSIAILTPVTHPSLEQTEKGFIQTIEAAYPGKYHFVTYNAQGNKTLMRSELDTIIRQDHALLLTIGTSASQMAAELLRKKSLALPLVFTSVNDPVGFQIVASEQAPDNTVTGVKELLNFQAQFNLLLQFKPQLQTILLVYNPAEPGLQKDQAEIQRLLQSKQIKLITVEIFQTNELTAKVTPQMASADAVIVLKDNTVITGLDALVKLCDRYQIPLMASDLDSPDRGAALGYGVHEIDFGIEAGKKALQILQEGITPGAIPITPVANFTLKINPAAALKQGIDPARFTAEEMVNPS